MDDRLQKAIRELRRSGLSWAEVLQALVIECDDVNVSEEEVAEVASQILKHKIDQHNHLSAKCDRCGHPTYWHGNGICLEPAWKVVPVFYHTGTDAPDGFTIQQRRVCGFCRG